MAELRAWRSARAREDAVPAYVVAHDALLLAIVEERPGSAAALRGSRAWAPRSSTATAPTSSRSWRGSELRPRPGAAPAPAAAWLRQAAGRRHGLAAQDRHEPHTKSPHAGANVSHVNLRLGTSGPSHRKGSSMRRNGFLGILFLVLVAVVAGLVGYQAGLTSSAAAAGATVVVTGGFPGLGFLFVLLSSGSCSSRSPAGGMGPGVPVRATARGPGGWDRAPRAGRQAPSARTRPIRAASGSPRCTEASTRTRRPSPIRRAIPRSSDGPLPSPSRRRAGILARRRHVQESMRTVLVVEDEPQIAALVRDYLEHAGSPSSSPATAGRASRSPAPAGRRPSCSTSGCPAWTAWTWSATCAATRPSRSSS